MASQNPLTQLIAHSALKVAQAGATVLPPAYLVSSLILRRGTGFSVRGLMRSANMAVLGGGALGAGAAWVRLRGASAESLEDRVFRLVRASPGQQTEKSYGRGENAADEVVTQHEPGPCGRLLVYRLGTLSSRHTRHLPKAGAAAFVSHWGSERGAGRRELDTYSGDVQPREGCEARGNGTSRFLTPLSARTELMYRSGSYLL